MSAGLVSIIVPAYNRAQFLEQCIRSGLDQSYGYVEVIVVDDGSTDASAGVLERLQEDQRLVVLRHPNGENRGQAASINLGLRQSRGEFINILDSDDFLEPTKLDIEVSFLRDHPEFGLVYSNGYLTDASGQPTHSYHAPEHQDPGSPDAALLDCYMALPVNALVRREVYDEVGDFEESFRAAQDHDMLVRMAEVTRFAYIPDHLFYYRRHEGSISATKQEVRWRTGFEILKRAKARYPYRRSTLRKRRAVLHFRMAQVYFGMRRRLLGMSHLAAAGLLDPRRGAAVALGFERT